MLATRKWKEPSLCAHWVAHRTTPIPLHQPMSGNVVMSGISENVRYHKNEAQATLVLRTECKKQVICVPGAEDPRHTTFINLNVLHAESAETLAALSG